jgi:hypothetical protein
VTFYFKENVQKLRNCTKNIESFKIPRKMSKKSKFRGKFRKLRNSAENDEKFEIPRKTSKTSKFRGKFRKLRNSLSRVSDPSILMAEVSALRSAFQI